MAQGGGEAELTPDEGDGRRRPRGPLPPHRLPKRPGEEGEEARDLADPRVAELAARLAERHALQARGGAPAAATAPAPPGAADRSVPAGQRGGVAATAPGGDEEVGTVGETRVEIRQCGSGAYVEKGVLVPERTNWKSNSAPFMITSEPSEQEEESKAKRRKKSSSDDTTFL